MNSIFEGLKVLDFANNMAGPLACSMFGLKYKHRDTQQLPEK